MAHFACFITRTYTHTRTHSTSHGHLAPVPRALLLSRYTSAALQDQRLFLVRNARAGADLLTRKRMLVSRGDQQSKTRPALLPLSPSTGSTGNGDSAGSRSTAMDVAEPEVAATADAGAPTTGILMSPPF